MANQECSSWAWWFTSVIPALGRLRQEDDKFEVSQGYISRPYLNKTKQNKQNNTRPSCSSHGHAHLMVLSIQAPYSPLPQPHSSEASCTQTICCDCWEAGIRSQQLEKHQAHCGHSTVCHRLMNKFWDISTPKGAWCLGQGHTDHGFLGGRCAPGGVGVHVCGHHS
jgi:hypothetical protein